MGEGRHVLRRETAVSLYGRLQIPIWRGNQRKEIAFPEVHGLKIEQIKAQAELHEPTAALCCSIKATTNIGGSKESEQ
jgi:hypothetical protein